MEKIEKKCFFLLIMASAVLLIYMLSVVTGNNALYADGSHHLMSMMLDENWNGFYTHRGGAMFLNYGFAYFALKIGVTSVKTLVDLFSFGASFWMVVFYILVLGVSYRKKNYKIMCFTILYFCFLLTNSGFMTVIQSNITAAWFWCCFVWIYLYLSTDYKQEIFIFLLSCIGININEYTVFLNLVLLALIVFRIKNGDIKISKYWYLTILAIMLGFFRGLDGTFINPDIDPSGDLINCIKVPVPLLWAQLATLAILLILLLVAKKKTSVILESLLVLSVISVCSVCIWRIISGINLISYYSNIVRIYSLVIPMMLGCYLILEQKMKVSVNENYLVIPAVTFLICFVIYYVGTTNDFQVYGSNTAQFCKDNEGFISRTEVNYDASYNWGWTSIEESLLLQAYYGNGNVQCVITSGEDDAAIANRDEFYEKYNKLQKYNIYLNMELLK